jgi:hypothetical protein
MSFLLTEMNGEIEYAIVEPQKVNIKRRKCQTVSREKLRKTVLFEKAARKMLVKLIP